MKLKGLFKKSSDSKNKDSSFNEEVGKRGERQSYKPIEIRFDALINSHCEKPFDWYKKLEIDRSDASKIRRGLLIPPRWLRIKIAQHFKTDSATIWKVDDLPYIRSIKKQGDTNESR